MRELVLEAIAAVRKAGLRPTAIHVSSDGCDLLGGDTGGGLLRFAGLEVHVDIISGLWIEWTRPVLGQREADTADGESLDEVNSKQIRAMWSRLAWLEDRVALLLAEAGEAVTRYPGDRP